MAWFLNKETGLKWEVVDEELIEKLSKDENYEEVKETQEKKTTSTKSKATVKK